MARCCLSTTLIPERFLIPPGYQLSFEYRLVSSVHVSLPNLYPDVYYNLSKFSIDRVRKKKNSIIEWIKLGWITNFKGITFLSTCLSRGCLKKFTRFKFYTDDMDRIWIKCDRQDLRNLFFSTSHQSECHSHYIDQLYSFWCWCFSSLNNS